MANSPISSITTGPRQSNVELLRIVAMLLVMVVHADFVALGEPPHTLSAGYEGVSELTRVAIEMAAMVCVNLFILISGWFSIKSSVKGFLNFAFQCVFFFTLTFFVANIGLAVTGKDVRWDDIGGCLALLSSNWFVKAYAGLYLIAPLLNLFCNNASERQLRFAVVLFFLYETVWGWIGDNNTVDRGYTAFSFIGLYMLARYMRLHYRGERGMSWLVVYFLTVGLDAAAYYLFPSWLTPLSYVNPLVVVGSLCLFMYFAGLKMKTLPWLNFVAASAFAAYLLHTAPRMMFVYKSAVKWTWLHTPGALSIISVFLVMAAFFAAAVAIDQLRIYLWKRWVCRLAVPIENIFVRLVSRS